MLSYRYRGVLSLAEKLEIEHESCKTLHTQAIQDLGKSMEQSLEEYQKAHFMKAFMRWKSNIKATHDAHE